MPRAGPSRRLERMESGREVDDITPLTASNGPSIESNTNGAHVSSSDEEKDDDDDDDDDDDGFDPSTVGPQPLEREVEVKLRTLKADYGPFEKTIEEQAMVFLADAAVGAEEAEGLERAVLDLDRRFRGLVDVYAEATARKSALDQIRQRLLQGEEILDATKIYNDLVSNELREHQSKTSRQKYSTHAGYKDLRERLWEVNHEGEPMPHINSFIEKEGDEESEDEEIVMGGQTQDYKCPLTLTVFVDPVTSNLCPHSFSREAIHEYILTSGGKANCPTAGCSKTLTMNNLRPDPGLAKRVKDMQRRQEMSLRRRQEGFVIE